MHVSKVKRTAVIEPSSTKQLTELAQRACLVAKDAAFNVRDYIENSSSIAYVAVKQCEKELDEMERKIDDEIPRAITDVTEGEARTLLACLKFIIDLERIGDLLWSVAQRIQQRSGRIPKEDLKSLLIMANALHEMLEKIFKGFITRDVALAESVLRADSDIDQACHAVFRRHLQSSNRRGIVESTNVLLMAQAFERAGDHTKNLAEEVFHLVQGYSLRHKAKARLGRE
jgi:phosphate transport system protein